MIQNKDRLTVTLSPQIKKLLIEICEVQGISASAFISMCVVRELKENSVFQLTNLVRIENEKNKNNTVK